MARGRAEAYERARREVARLAHTQLEPAPFLQRAAAALARAVPFDGGCWHTVDPATLLVTSHATNLSGEGFAAVCRYEYARGDVLSFASLAGRTRPVGILKIGRASCRERV